MEFVSANKAAELLGLTSTTVVRWLEEGRFPNARVYSGSTRNTIRIPLSDIEELIKEAS